MKNRYVCDKCGDESLTKDVCSICGQIIEHLDPQTAVFIPRLGNSFVAVTKCPYCHKESEIEFMAFIGEWSISSFKTGDEVFVGLDQIRESKGCPLEGINSWKELIDVDFGVYGFGRCWECNNMVWSRIEVQNNRIADIRVVSKPVDADSLDILKKWEHLEQNSLNKK